MDVSRVPIALQLYTVRGDTTRDFTGTVRAVAEVGYDAVEFAGYGGLSSDELRELLHETGLRVAGSHVGADRLEEDLDGEIDYCHAIGCEYLVLPSLPDALRGTENLPAAIALLTDIGARCRDRGIIFAYHNHDFEFVATPRGIAWELMVDGTQPDLVSFELDVYWAAFAGEDPGRLLNEHAGRIPLVHLKDMGGNRAEAEVGEGNLNLGQLYLSLAERGISWAIVEQDNPPDPALESSRTSLQNLRSYPRQEDDSSDPVRGNP